jgi:ABC-type glycerol-3-phosphate transport system substrate-binding protein
MKRHLSRRSFLKGSLAVSSVSLLAACIAPTAGSSGTSGQGPSAQQSTVVVESRTGESQEAWFNQITQWFAEENPDIQVEMRYTPYGEYRQKMTIGLAGGTVGDIIWTVAGIDYEEYVGKGILHDISDLVTSDNYDLGQFYPSAIATGTVAGKLYGLPVILHPNFAVIVLNQDLFEKAGLPLLDETADTSTILSIAQKLTLDSDGRPADDPAFDPQKATQFGLDAGSAWYSHAVYWWDIISSFGGTTINAEGTKTTIQEPEAVAAIQWLADLRQSLHVSPAPGQIVQSPEAMFVNGQIAMLPIQYGAQATIVQVENFAYAAAPVMRGPVSRTTTAFADYYCMAGLTKAPEATFAYLKEMASKRAGLLNAELFFPGARPDVWEDTSLSQKESSPFHALFAAQFVDTVAPAKAANFRQLQFLDMLTSNTGLIWEGTMAVEEALQVTSERVDEVLALPAIEA